MTPPPKKCELMIHYRPNDLDRDTVSKEIWHRDSGLVLVGNKWMYLIIVDVYGWPDSRIRAFVDQDSSPRRNNFNDLTNSGFLPRNKPKTLRIKGHTAEGIVETHLKVTAADDRRSNYQKFMDSGEVSYPVWKAKQKKEQTVSHTDDCVTSAVSSAGLNPYFCDGKSPKAQAWYESRTKAQLGELVAELICRLIEMKDSGEWKPAQYGDDKYYGRWIKYIPEIENGMSNEDTKDS